LTYLVCQVTEGLSDILSQSSNHPITIEAKTNIIQWIVYKITITKNDFRLHFYIGQDHIENKLNIATRFLKDLTKQLALENSQKSLNT
jgi:hypothetical protein